MLHSPPCNYPQAEKEAAKEAERAAKEEEKAAAAAAKEAERAAKEEEKAAKAAERERQKVRLERQGGAGLKASFRCRARLCFWQRPCLAGVPELCRHVGCSSKAVLAFRSCRRLRRRLRRRGPRQGHSTAQHSTAQHSTAVPLHA